MKLLHLADLHIGKTVNGFSMLEDQEEILSQIMGLVRNEKPDAVLIAGDVYDKPTPGAEAVRLFDRFLTDLSREPCAVLLISGNHDSPERLGFGGGIMEEQGVVFSCVFEGQMKRITLEDRHGPVRFYLLPFLRPSTVRRFYEEQEIGSYQDAVKAVIGSARVNQTERNVLLAHQFFVSSGKELQRSDSEVGPVGGIDSVDASVIAGFDYVALGHLHGPQQVGNAQIRYGGSPLKYSASECRHKKSVPLVELREKGAVEVTLIPLQPKRDMRAVRGPLQKLLEAANASEGLSEDYIHVTLTDEEEVLDAMGKLRAVYPNVMSLAFENRRTQAVFAAPEQMNVTKIDAFGLFCELFESQNGTGLTGAQAAVVKRKLSEMGGVE